MEELPNADCTFDVVAGFNSFQFATSPLHALQEARRVSRPGASLVIAVFGRRKDTEAVPYFAAVGLLLPPPPGAPGPFALSVDGALEALVAQAACIQRKSRSSIARGRILMKGRSCADCFHPVREQGLFTTRGRRRHVTPS
jgi:SAM-dependent methyltransferase